MSLSLASFQVYKRDQQHAEPCWMIGHLNNKQGCFPEAYVQLMSDENVAAADTSSNSSQLSQKLPSKETPDLFSNSNIYDTFGLASIIFLFFLFSLHSHINLFATSVSL